MERLGFRRWEIYVDENGNSEIGYHKLVPDRDKPQFIFPDPEIIYVEGELVLVHFRPQPEDATMMRLSEEAGTRVQLLGHGSIQISSKIVHTDDDKVELHIPFNKTRTVIFDCD